MKRFLLAPLLLTLLIASCSTKKNLIHIEKLMMIAKSGQKKVELMKLQIQEKLFLKQIVLEYFYLKEFLIKKFIIYLSDGVKMNLQRIKY